MKYKITIETIEGDVVGDTEATTIRTGSSFEEALSNVIRDHLSYIGGSAYGVCEGLIIALADTLDEFPMTGIINEPAEHSALDLVTALAQMFNITIPASPPTTAPSQPAERGDTK